MSRRRKPNEGSLDLLLDTICNTFGGILFVAMLVVVMLRMTARVTGAESGEAVSQMELLDLEGQQTTVRAMLESKQLAAEQLATHQSLVDPNAMEMWQQLQEKLKTHQSLVDAKLATLGRTAKLRQALSRQTSESERSDSHEQKMKVQIAALTSQLDEEKNKHTRDATLPQIKGTTKTEVQTVLRYDHFYIWHTYDRFGNRAGLNTNEFVVLEDKPGALVTTPLPYAGSPIDDSDVSRQSLKSRLAAFDSAQHYVQISVWPDSYATFRFLKNTLVAEGFDYRLVPATDDSIFVDRGGNSEGIQ